MMTACTVIIVSYNTRQHTLACLESVYAQTKSDVQVIVVDNASHDGSADAIATEFPQTTLIRMSKNVGFAEANNVAGRKANGQYILLLNPDTVILDGAIDKAIKFARLLPEPAVIGARTVLADGTLNKASCHGRPTVWSTFCAGVGLSTLFRGSPIFNTEGMGNWERDSLREVDCITGCFMMVESSIWHRLGGLDTTYFMYFEDTDFCVRARNLGLTCILNPDITLIHHGGASEPVLADKIVRLFRAKTQYFDRYWKRRDVIFGYYMLCLWALTRLTLTSVLTTLTGKFQNAYKASRDIFQRRHEFAPPVRALPVPVTAVPGNARPRLEMSRGQ